MEVIESVNVHEDIKLGLPGRDAYIDNYRETVRRLGQAGVKVICYNFMPVFDWTRTDLAKPRPDGSTVLAYDQAVIDRITDPQAFADQIQQGAGEFEMAAGNRNAWRSSSACLPNTGMSPMRTCSAT